MTFRTAAPRRAGAGIPGTSAVLVAAVLATGQPGPVLAATPVLDATAAASMAAPGTNLPFNPKSWPANRGDLFAGRRYGETRSADVRHAECALRHRRLPWPHQDQRRGTHNQPAPAPAPLTPPAADVPGYQHVFLFHFENEDYSQIIGNTKQAPYLNSLRGRGATLMNFYAEEHPSDANYLALAGGSAFGVPLTDPEERGAAFHHRRREHRRSRDRQRRIVEDLSAERERPMRRHATTPNFAWVGMPYPWAA
jgi:hypothetical protein